jgi:hypothetical protein
VRRKSNGRKPRMRPLEDDANTPLARGEARPQCPPRRAAAMQPDRMAEIDCAGHTNKTFAKTICSAVFPSIFDPIWQRMPRIHLMNCPPRTNIQNFSLSAAAKRIAAPLKLTRPMFSQRRSPSAAFWNLRLGASLELGRLVLGIFEPLIPAKIARAGEPFAKSFLST